MPGRIARGLTYVAGVAFALLGLPMFFASQAIAPIFAWKVSGFVTMTIGAWCLGNAWLAWITARRWRGRLVYSTIVYLGLFGMFELAVVFAFREKLVVEHPLAWLYLAALGLSAAVGVLRLLTWVPRRVGRESFGPPVPPSLRGVMIAFVVFAGLLGVYGLAAPLGAPGTNGGIFPEVMSLFTLRSFGAFYLALALAVGVLLSEPSLPPPLHHAFASYGLILTIAAAAVVHLRLFDFAARPGGLLYVGVYLILGVLGLIVFRAHGTGLRRGPQATDAARDLDRRQNR